jgi:deferrochelatase/peroxidase EfeB
MIERRVPTKGNVAHRGRQDGGRSRAGDPLDPIRGIEAKLGEKEQNRFTLDQDPAGTRCPFGAHLRSISKT